MGGRGGQKCEQPGWPGGTAGNGVRFVEDGGPLGALVAERDGMLVGFTHYLFHRNTNMIEPVCYLEDLFTAEAARGKGVGRALIESVCAEARAAGLRPVDWITHETQKTAPRRSARSEERSVGKGRVSTCRHRWPRHYI